MNFQNTATQIRPCIVSKAIFALGLKNNIPQQNVRQSCTPDYWIRTINTICVLNGVNNDVQRQTAINRFDELINN